MSDFVIDSGIETAADLAGILPEEVRERLLPQMLTDAPTASALRVLATIDDRNGRWCDAVGPVGIDWAPVLKWARTRPGGPANSIRVRLEIAASLYGHPGAHVQLRYAATVMERHSYLAVLDALRIAVEGLKP